MTTDAVTNYYKKMLDEVGTRNAISNQPGKGDSPETPLTCTCEGNVIQNPSFENGTTSWSWTGGNFDFGTYGISTPTDSAVRKMVQVKD